MDPTGIVIPPELRPRDGRFGSGPSKVRPEAVAALLRGAGSYLGTSHRRPAVRSMIRRLKDDVATLLALPAGYEVVLGVGGATVLWDALAFGLIARRSAHLVFGEFSSRFADAVGLAPWLSEPRVIASDAGTYPEAVSFDDVDVYALTHNETSTGVAMPVTRVAGDALMTVDGTSAAGGLHVDPLSFDLYYFSPQKCLASDGGLWIALCSPAALERIDEIAGSQRYIPPSLDLLRARELSGRDQTYNTPALATVFLAVEQLEWMLDRGGLEWAVRRCEHSSGLLYSWAERHELARPFVTDVAKRSPVVVTIDFSTAIDAGAIAAALRANGIVDTEPYRKLGRNQLRVATYPAIEPSDVDALTRAIDYVVAMLS